MQKSFTQGTAAKGLSVELRAKDLLRKEGGRTGFKTGLNNFFEWEFPPQDQIGFRGGEERGDALPTQQEMKGVDY